jgi:Bacterial Ig-like domain (group 1)
VTIEYTFANAADAQAAATTAVPTALFFDNNLFTDTQIESTTGVPQITFQPFDTTNPPTDNGVPSCPAASLLTPTVTGNVVSVTVTSPGYGLVLVDFPTNAGTVITPPTITLDVTSGDGQTGAVGSPLAAPLVVTVDDSHGGVIAGVPVTFQVASGAGTLSAANAVTDASGQAQTTLTVGAAGPIEVQASAVDLAPVGFVATGE